MAWTRSRKKPEQPPVNPNTIEESEYTESELENS